VAEEPRVEDVIMVQDLEYQQEVPFAEPAK